MAAPGDAGDPRAMPGLPRSRPAPVRRPVARTRPASALEDGELVRELLGPRAAAGLARGMEAAGGLVALLAGVERGDGEAAHLGPAALRRARLLLEAARRLAPLAAGPRPRVTSPGEALAHLGFLAGLDRERLVVLCLDGRSGLLARETVAIGAVNAVSASPRDVLEPVVRCGGLRLVLAHNHPSGDPTPSAEDIAFTRRVERAAGLLGLQLLDHLVVARGGMVSLREAGHL